MKLFRIHIVIHNLGAPRFEMRNWEDKNARTIHLSYHDNNHYSSVRNASDTLWGNPSTIAELKFKGKSIDLKEERQMDDRASKV